MFQHLGIASFGQTEISRVLQNVPKFEFVCEMFSGENFGRLKVQIFRRRVFNQ